jgi:hypothetical protein
VSIMWYCIDMANNRLYICDQKTGDKFLLLKSFGVGWNFWYGGPYPRGDDSYIIKRIDELVEWLDKRDEESSCGNSNGKTDLFLVDENNDNGALT